MDLDQLMATFMAEAHECLNEIERNTLDLADGADSATLQEIYRQLHTLKGGASCVALEALTRASHHAEDLVSSAIATNRSNEASLAGLLLHTVDILTNLLGDAEAGRQDDHDPRVEALAERCTTWIASVAVPREPSSGDANVAVAVEAPTQTIRVEVSRLDEAMELAGGLTVARGRLADAIAHADIARAASALEAADSLIRGLEQQILALRLVPLRSGFERLRRPVRDVAASTGKDVQLEIDCAELEVDMAVAEALRAPLTHMIRNAIDHGIEDPDARIACGKPRQGRIEIKARHATGELFVEVIDDGRGIARERLISRAATMGLDVEELTDEQILDLAFVPGLSTADAIGDLSGRGIGMDVVRRSIETLRGSVRITSKPGHGTTVELRLPLALSIIHGLAVRVGSEAFVLPIDSVVECVELDRAHAIESARGGVLELRGEALPYRHLGEHFGARAEDGVRSNVIVVQHDGLRAGIEVDALFGEVQTVIKPMGTLFRGVSGIAGSAVIGDGQIALVVDVRGLLRAVTAPRLAA